MRIYIAGPMHGYPEDNVPLFDAVTAYLREKGYDICSPVECACDVDRTLPQETLWIQCLKKDLIGLLGCEGIALLPNWELSKGATFELLVAVMLGYRIHFVEEVREPKEGVRRYNLWSSRLSKSQVLGYFCRVHFPVIAQTVETLGGW